MVYLRLTSLFLILFTVAACSSSKRSQAANRIAITGLRFLDEFIVPNGMQFKGTTVGGLSGIDYDLKRDQYYLACDDPSVFNPARFYTAKILFTERGIDTVLFISVDTLRDRFGKPFPDIRADRVHSADIEAMRYDASRDELVWSTEGQRVMNDSVHDLQDPAIYVSDRQGKFKDSFPLPAMLRVQATPMGPRHNSVLEGMSFDPEHRHLYLNIEEPLFEDGPRAANGDSTAVIRILKFNRKLKQNVAQYAYETGPVPYPPDPPGAFKINGVPDILYLGDEKFIVIERAFSAGRRETDIRIYLADASDAEDVLHIASLQSRAGLKLIKKQLLIDLNESLANEVFNIEGICFGPPLANGNRSLLLVSDNNFNNRERTQFFLFEVLP